MCICTCIGRPPVYKLNPSDYGSNDDDIDDDDDVDVDDDDADDN